MTKTITVIVMLLGFAALCEGMSNAGMYSEYNTFDVNGDGKITIVELRDGLVSHGIHTDTEDKATAELMFKKYDEDDDGLDMREFETLLESENINIFNKSFDDVHEMFKKYTDSYGQSLNMEKFKTLLKEENIDISESHAELMFKKYDKKDDGLDKREFETLLKDEKIRISTRGWVGGPSLPDNNETDNDELGNLLDNYQDQPLSYKDEGVTFQLPPPTMPPSTDEAESMFTDTRRKWMKKGPEQFTTDYMDLCWGNELASSVLLDRSKVQRKMSARWLRFRQRAESEEKCADVEAQYAERLSESLKMQQTLERALSRYKHLSRSAGKNPTLPYMLDTLGDEMALKDFLGKIEIQGLGSWAPGPEKPTTTTTAKPKPKPFKPEEPPATAKPKPFKPKPKPCNIRGTGC